MNNFDPELGIYLFYEETIWNKWWFWLIIIFSILFVVVLTSFLVYKFLWHKIFPKKQLNASEWALSQLSLLKPESLEDYEAFKKFYFSLTSIIKLYLKRRYRWDLEHKTDEEVSEFLYETALNAEHKVKLKELFLGAQIIKFTNHGSMQDQAKKDFERAVSFVEETREVSN